MRLVEEIREVVIDKNRKLKVHHVNQFFDIKSSAPWSSNYVVTRRYGKTRTAGDFTKLIQNAR